MPQTLQDIHRLRQQKDFVGREEQIKFFGENLRYPPEDPRRRFILSVSGQGGVGKTWLLREFHRIAEKMAVTAWTDEAQESVTEVLGRIAEQFDAQKHPLKTFAERYKVYRQRKQELEADPEAPQGMAAFVGRTLAKGGLRLARRVPIGGVAADFVDEQAFASLAGDFASYVARKIGNKDEVRLVLEPLEVLTPLFLDDLQHVAGEKPVVLFFDTYERTGPFLDAWLRDVLDGRYGDVPADILLVIAGRDELDRNLWAAYDSLLARLPLEPFTGEEARGYLARKGIADERVVEVILNLSGRLPLLLSTLAAARPSDPTRVEDPSDEAVARFLKWVEDPKQRQVALDAALPRWLNRDVLAVLTGEEAAEALFGWLQGMPFLQKREAGWDYHEVVRTQMLRYKRQQSPRGWADLHGRLAGYYERSRDELGLDEKSAPRDEAWQRHTLEATYHRLCGAAHRHLAEALNGFVTAWEASADFARRWAATLRQAGADSDALPVQEWGERLAKGLEAYHNDDHPQALAFLTALLEEGHLKDGQRASILGRRGVTYLLMGQYEPALADFTRAIELDPNYAGAIARRGETCRLMEQYDQALADFTRAIELDPNDAWAIASRGETCRLMEQYDQALADFTRAIELDPDDWHLYDRALLYQKMGQGGQAEADLAAAIRRARERYQEKPQDWNNTLNLALYYLAAGAADEAERLYREAIAGGAPVHVLREALHDLDDFLALFPAHSQAQAMRDLLQAHLGQAGG